MKKIRHLDLFSGIGGFALAAREVWGEEHEIVGFCDNDSFCQNVLAKNFPGTPIYGDIRELTAERLAADSGGEEPHRLSSERREEVASSRQRHQRIDLLTGGFPCQPFSNAGKKRGDKDDRFLWPEMLRVIRETKPAWVIGENVAGIINMALDQVCADLEGEGYEVQPFVIPACAVGAPHRRDRVWIVARSNTDGLDAWRQKQNRGQGRQGKQERAHSIAGGCDAPDAVGGGLRQESPHAGRGEQGVGAQGPLGIGSPFRPFQRSEWGRDWREVALATCHDRVDDGLPERMARLPDGSEISEARLRRESLKAYGNAIVPQVAAEIFASLGL